jgi:hypothetical protein
VRAFGEGVFDIIEQEPYRLREVTGTWPLCRVSRARQLCLEERPRRSLKKAMASLAGFRLPDAEDPRVQAQLRKMEAADVKPR